MLKSHYVIIAEMKNGDTMFVSIDDSSGGYCYFTDTFPTMWLSEEKAKEYLSLWENENNRHYLFDKANKAYVKKVNF